MDTVTEALQAKIKELGLKQRHIASKLIISEVYLSMQLHGTAQINPDEFYQLCGLLGLNPKELMKQYQEDFSESGSIPAMAYRPRYKNGF